MLCACVDVWEDLYGRESEESKGTSESANDRGIGKNDSGKAKDPRSFDGKGSGQEEDDGRQT
jgi:hypothetical protein